MLWAVVGFVVGVFVTGLVAHRWPQLFAKIDAQGAEVVNQAIDQAKAVANTASK